jgi:transcriptional regulator with XRE-family HTH domain
MIFFGKKVKRYRTKKGLSQQMLAQRIGMSSVQLCKIEHGNSSPTLDTVERIAEALGVPLGVLLSNEEVDVKDLDDANGIRNTRTGDCSRFVPVRIGCYDEVVDLDVLKTILQAENDGKVLEGELGIEHITLLPLVHAFQIDKRGACLVAKSLRYSCAALGVAFSNWVELLAFWNVRFHCINIGKDVKSRSYFDTENRSFSIVIDKKDTPERHANRIAYELAWFVIFASHGFKPIRDTSLRHRFARDFASEFLMPEETVRFTVKQLGVRPNDWTLEMICELKSRFGVSAEAFALRLEELGLIGCHLRQKIRDELREYYNIHPNAMEPSPCLSSLDFRLRSKLLKMELERRKLKI